MKKSNCKKKNSANLIFMIVMLFMLLVVVAASCVVNKAPEHRFQWWLAAIEWSDKQSANGSGIKIAIVDSGINSSHKDLSKANIKQLSVLDSSDDEGDNRHGTAVAGILVAYPHDEKGLLGICPRANLISIDVTNSKDGLVNEKNLVLGIEKAINEGVDIISISIGTHQYSNSMEKVINKAQQKGIIVIASAGNYMVDDLLYPAKFEGVIAVGSKTKKNTIISPKISSCDKTVFYLPGDNICTLGTNNDYVNVYGTSFSTAIMTGIIAIAMQKDRDISYEVLDERLLELQEQDAITAKRLLKK